MPAQFYLAFILLAAFAVGYLLPRLSAYFLGPALLAVTALAFVCLHGLFFGGSMGALVAWVVAVLACAGGIVLIATGLTSQAGVIYFAVQSL